MFVNQCFYTLLHHCILVHFLDLQLWYQNVLSFLLGYQNVLFSFLYKNDLYSFCVLKRSFLFLCTKMFILIFLCIVNVVLFRNHASILSWDVFSFLKGVWQCSTSTCFQMSRWSLCLSWSLSEINWSYKKW